MGSQTVINIPAVKFWPRNDEKDEGFRSEEMSYKIMGKNENDRAACLSSD